MENPEVQIIRKAFTFKRPAGTSRGTLYAKDSWFILLKDTADPLVYGMGECAPLPKLSPEVPDRMDHHLQTLREEIKTAGLQHISVDPSLPSIRFGLETAVGDLENGGTRLLFPSDFTRGEEGIRINGLIWMGDRDFMLRQIHEKMELGFRVIKIKIGSLHFEQELDILKYIRTEYRKEAPEIRLDANGAFNPREAAEKLRYLSDYDIHSIEQPIAAGQWESMASLCAGSPIPIALDEELIGITREKEMESLLGTIQPNYLILKPTLLGGFSFCERWMTLAEKHGTGWWVTSALETPIGLNAIAQWTATHHPSLPQGLGTGNIYKDFPDTPLYLSGDSLWYDPEKTWKPETLWQA